MKKSWIKRGFVAAAAVFLIGAGALVGWSQYLVHRSWDAPLPPIAADLSASGVARGEAIFGATCAGCHLDPATQRYTGAHLADIPKFLGSVHSANLTADRLAGVGARSDAEIARMIRYGVRHDGRRGFMPTSSMSDADVAAVIGFLRSADPGLAAHSKRPPATELSVPGAILLAATGAFRLSDIAPSGVVAPAAAPTPEYGRYLAESVYDCGGCHTPGFSPDKLEGDSAFAGGFEFADHAGEKIWSANITFDQTGIDGWTVDEFQTAITSGLRRDGSALRYPMVKYRKMEPLESEAIYRYLQTLPKRRNIVKGRHTMGPTLAAANTEPAQVYDRLGCDACHGASAPYREQFVAARAKSPTDLAKWIRNPEAYKPGTAMPTYASMLTEGDAEKLAQWIVAGGA